MKNLKSQQVRTVVWMGECSPFFSGTRHLWGREKTGGNQSSTNSPFCPRNIPIWLSMVPFHTQQLMVVMDCFKVGRTAHNHGHQHLGRFFESFIDWLAEQTFGGQMDWSIIQCHCTFMNTWEFPARQTNLLFSSGHTIASPVLRFPAIQVGWDCAKILAWIGGWWHPYCPALVLLLINLWAREWED